jgi:putative transcriptional regulator
VSRPRPSAPPTATGLGALRRLGAVSDLLFLYECTTREVGQLRAVAEPLGLSVQAASHTYRGLRRRGLVELREGRYRPTVAGVAWMHATLAGLGEDLTARLERLHIVRRTHALARSPIDAGASVVLAVEDGLLTARTGRAGASTGTARGSARPGELVEVAELEGIVAIRPGTVRLLVVPGNRLADPALLVAIENALPRGGPELLAAPGLEAYHLASRARPSRPVLRFGVAGAVEEASRLGVGSTVIVLDRELPRLLNEFQGPQPPPIEYVSLPGSRHRRPGRVGGQPP